MSPVKKFNSCTSLVTSQWTQCKDYVVGAAVHWTIAPIVRNTLKSRVSCRDSPVIAPPLMETHIPTVLVHAFVEKHRMSEIDTNRQFFWSGNRRELVRVALLDCKNELAAAMFLVKKRAWEQYDTIKIIISTEPAGKSGSTVREDSFVNCQRHLSTVNHAIAHSVSDIRIFFMFRSMLIDLMPQPCPHTELL